MPTDPRPPRAPAREIRVEGATLYLTLGVLLMLLAGAFLLGRRVGQASAPATVAPTELSAQADAEAIEAAPEARADYFDTTNGGEKQPEPGRETARRDPAPPDPPGTRADTPPAPVGPYYVQVFAGRDRRAAEGLVKSLGTRGYPVRLDSQREGGGALYKVRVGGYATQDEARAMAERLRKDGEAGAWVTRVDG